MSTLSLDKLTVAQREALLGLARKNRLSRKTGGLPPVERIDRNGALQLSFAQQRLWFIDQFDGIGTAYHIRGGMRLKGHLDRSALRRALDAIVVRHESLRTRFVRAAGEPAQQIAPAEESCFHLVEHDVSQDIDRDVALRRITAGEADIPFDLSTGPLIRGRLVRLAEDEYAFLVTMHHIVSDGWSMGVFINELSSLYAAFRRGASDPLPPLEVQYADYAAWQRRRIAGDVLQRQADYWESALAGAPEVLALPTDRMRPAEQDFAGAYVDVVFDEILTDALNAFSRKHGTTLFMTLLAGWAALLSRLSGQQDVVIGSPIANRSHKETENLIGFFVNTLALRIDLSGSPTVTELLERVKSRALEAQQNQDIPFEQVVEIARPARSLAHSPLFQVMFAWQNAPAGTLAFPELTIVPLPSAPHVTAKFDLSWSLQESGGRISGALEYATALFDRATVEHFVGYYRALLTQMVADETCVVDCLPILPASEREQLLEEWNATEAALPDGSVAELFELQAERGPDAVAVVEGDGSISYAELNARANRLAHHLRTRGVEPGDRVVVTMPRSTELVIAELAILKCGAAYVPVDATFPAERIAFMTADCGANVVLEREDVDVAGPSENLGIGVGSESAAYVMYTSGSTGEPKGVVVPHRAVVRLVINNRYADFGADDRVAFASNPAFDATTLEVWAPLLNGGRIVVIDQDALLDPRQFGETLRRDGVTVLWMTVGLFNQYADALSEEIGALRYLIVGGDALDARVIARVLSRRAPQHLLNGYGPTETTTFAITHEIRSVEAGARSIPLGRPIGNTKVYILDERSQPVPVGVAGEIYIGGMGVALGYLNREELTAERFVENPFHGGRMYRTGDVGRWLADGTIEFLGRNDQQVKIRGFRIELGEIEAGLGSHPSLGEVVVIAREGEDEKRLVAYYTSDEEVGAEALRAHVSQTLPEYMVPAAYVRLDAMPLTRNGKVDRQALPAPEGDAYATREYEGPQGEIERALAAIWAEVLKVERVGRHDNFFELGGHSLLAVTLIERMRQQGLHADVRALFATPTVAELAQRAGGERLQIEVPPNRIPIGCEAITPEMLPLVELSESEIDRIVRSVAGGAQNVQDIYPLAPLQEGILFHHLMANEGDAYLLSSMFAFDTRERAEGFVAAFQAVVNRHDILRTGVIWEGLSEPVQVVWRETTVPVEDVQLDGTGGDAAAELYARFDPRRHRIDLRQAPLMRMVVARDDENDRWLLLLLFHHLIGDHTTMEVVHEEVESHLLGRGEELRPALPFRNFVAEARMGVSKEEHEEFFRKLLGEVDEPTAPYGLLDVRGDGSAVGEARIEIEGTLARRVRERARKLGISAASLWHLAWAQVLARLSGREDVVFGTVLFGRMQGGEGADRVTGLFINTLPVRIRVGSVAAQTAARGTHDLLAELMRHEHASLALAQRCSAIEAPAPLFSALLNYRHSATAGRARSVDSPRAWAGITALYGEERTNYPITVSIDDLGESFRVTAQVAEPVRPIRICQYLETALAHLVDALDDAPDAALNSLEVLPAAEREQVLDEWSSVSLPVPEDRCIHELFEEQVARTPRAIAVIDQDQSLTYQELNTLANRLAHRLRAMGVGPDARVALCLGRNLDMAVGIMAVLKAGGAYVPLDPAFPSDRLRFIFENNAPLVLLANGGREQLFAGSDVPVIDVSSNFDDEPATNLKRGALTPANLAYVIYTSGSTGVPKGVMAEHRGAVNQLWAFCNMLRLTAADRVMWTTSYAFDPSVLELFMPMIVGAPTIIVDGATKKDPALLGAAVTKAGGTVLQATPATWRTLVESGWAGIKGLKALCGGEALTVELSAQMRARVGEVWNVYGPTEGTVYATAEKVPDASDDGRLTESIGRPIANTRIYILNAHGQPVPVGIAGEIHVGGVQVTRGYMNRPDLTSEKFVVDPFGAPGERMYKTGDLGRWRPDGSIEFIGRNDFQVKVRGFRIELGEIETHLATHPGVNQTVVIAREDVPGDRRLVAYYTGEDLGAEALREHLGATLPTYMLPAAYVHLDAMPMTSTGKINRKTLPAPEGPAFIERRFEAPIGEVEEQLAAIWTEVLGRERIGRHDDFFDLGGHSLLVVQLVSRVRQTLGVDVALGDVFDSPVLSEFAGRLASHARTTQSMIVPAERTANMPLSFAQQRLWFLDQLDVAGAAYHIPIALSLVGPLDRPALRQALDRIVQRHEALRTTFHDLEGEPVQRVTTTGRFTLAERDLRGHPSAQDDLRAIVADEAKAPFDLTHGPLIRGQLIRLADDGHALLVTIHHIVSDGWSMGLFINELNTLYAAFHRGEADPLPPLPVQYADYAAWQRTSIAGDVLQEQADFWKRTLQDAPELLELPGDRPRPAQQSFAGDLVSFDLGDQLSSQIKLLSRRHGTTVFMTLLAACAALFARLSGREDLVIGTPTANRGQKEIEGLIGFFVNTLPLRIDVSGSPTVAELLARVKAQTLAAQQHQEIPFEQIVEIAAPVRSAAYTPVFQVLFALQNAETSFALPELNVSTLEGSSHATSRFDLSLVMRDEGERIVGGVEYATSLFDRETMQRYLGHLRNLIEAMVADDAESVDRLPLLTPAERHEMVERWNDTAVEYARDACIHELFEQQVHRSPDSVAVVDGERSLTYAELNARANALAHHLRGLGVRDGENVVVLMPRSPVLVIAELAVLKCGAAYVPIDPSFPPDRIAFMVEDCGARFLVARHEDVLPPLSGIARVDVDDPESANRISSNLGVRVDSTAVAYVMYTSGSTGQPKGVVVPHRAVLRVVLNNRYAAFDRTDRVAFAANPAFDATTMEVWAPLLNGGCIVVIDQDAFLDPVRLAAALARHSVTALFVTTAIFNQCAAMVPNAFGGLRYLMTGGERCDPSAFARVLCEGKPEHLIHCYGPTETTTFATTWEVNDVPDGAQTLPIGKPIANTRIYILDAHGEPVPVGVSGEIFIGGSGVANGYLNRPELTAERFLADPFSSVAGARMYRTGDVARWLADGNIEFVGRNDFQVKIRGFRIELGEIEARLDDHLAVRDVVVLAREDNLGDKRLVAYYTGERVAAEELRAHVAATLPEYMVPAAYVHLDALPLTLTGKVDRAALSAPEWSDYSIHGYRAPQGETETALAAIWCEVLGIEQVGRDDDFFELGGHSLLATKLVFRVKQKLDVEIELMDVFEASVLSALSERILNAQLEQFDPAELAELVEKS